MSFVSRIKNYSMVSSDQMVQDDGKILLENIMPPSKAFEIAIDYNQKEAEANTSIHNNICGSLGHSMNSAPLNIPITSITYTESFLAASIMALFLRIYGLFRGEGYKIVDVAYENIHVYLIVKNPGPQLSSLASRPIGAEVIPGWWFTRIQLKNPLN